MFRSLLQSLPYRCSGDFWMFCHQSCSEKIPLITHHWWAVRAFKSPMSDIKIFQMQFPSLLVFLVVFHHFSELTYLHEKRGRRQKENIFCTSLFTVFNWLLQNLSQDVIPCTLKEEEQLSVQCRNHRTLRPDLHDKYLPAQLYSLLWWDTTSDRACSGHCNMVTGAKLWCDF